MIPQYFKIFLRYAGLPASFFTILEGSFFFYNQTNGTQQLPLLYLLFNFLADGEVVNTSEVLQPVISDASPLSNCQNEILNPLNDELNPNTWITKKNVALFALVVSVTVCCITLFYFYGGPPDVEDVHWSLREGSPVPYQSQFHYQYHLRPWQVAAEVDVPKLPNNYSFEWLQKNASTLKWSKSGLPYHAE